MATYYITSGSDPADAGSHRLSNAETIAWEASPAGTDVSLTCDSSEVLTLAGSSGFAIGSAGVKLSDDGDGAFTMLGLGNGNDESLTWNLDDGAQGPNTVSVTSATDVDLLNFGYDDQIRIALPYGNSSAPGLTFASDLDTGIYGNGSDFLGATAGGTVVFYQDVGGGASGQSRMRTRQGDLTSTCTLNEWALDTGGATKEMCFCQATNTWYCTSITTATGPTD
jgi:hypothetical protein